MSNHEDLQAVAVFVAVAARLLLWISDCTIVSFTAKLESCKR